MGLGVGIVLAAVGAVLAFAVSATVSGVNIHAVGWILLIVGIVGILLSMIFWSSWAGPGYFTGSRRRTTTSTRGLRLRRTRGHGCGVRVERAPALPEGRPRGPKVRTPGSLFGLRCSERRREPPREAQDERLAHCPPSAERVGARTWPASYASVGDGASTREDSWWRFVSRLTTPRPCTDSFGGWPGSSTGLPSPSIRRVVKFAFARSGSRARLRTSSNSSKHGLQRAESSRRRCGSVTARTRCAAPRRRQRLTGRSRRN